MNNLQKVFFKLELNSFYGTNVNKKDFMNQYNKKFIMINKIINKKHLTCSCKENKCLGC
jgi:hypothetical protein